MKRRFVTAVFAILAIVSTTAQAQELADGKITARGITMGQRNGETVLEMTLDVEKNAVSSTQSIAITPTLSDKTREVRFPYVLVNGKERSRIYERRLKFANDELMQNLPGQVMTIDGKHRSGKIDYSAGVESEPWMEGAELSLKYTLISPAGERQTYTTNVAAAVVVSEQVLVPEPVVSDVAAVPASEVAAARVPVYVPEVVAEVAPVQMIAPAVEVVPAVAQAVTPTISVTPEHTVVVRQPSGYNMLLPEVTSVPEPAPVFVPETDRKYPAGRERADISEPVIVATETVSRDVVAVSATAPGQWAVQDTGANVRVLAGSAYLDFEAGSDRLEPYYKRNPQELAAIDRAMKEIVQTPGAAIVSVSITGYASPEGREDNNLALSYGRAMALARHLQYVYGIPMSMSRAIGVGEDWYGLSRMVAGGSLPYSDRVLEVVDGAEYADAKESKLRRMMAGQIWRAMTDEMFPALRRVEYKIEYRVAE